MLSKNPVGSYDPKKMVRLQAVRPLYIAGKPIAVDEVFEIAADQVGDVLSTLRAKFVDENDRPLVYKQVHVW